MTCQEFIEWAEESSFITVDGVLCKILKRDDAVIFIEWDVDTCDIVLDNDEDFFEFCRLSVSESNYIDLEKDQYDRPYVTIGKTVSDKEQIVTRFFQEGH